MTSEEEQPQWSIPRILLGIVVLGIAGWFVYQNRSMIESFNGVPHGEVAGAHTQVKVTSNETIAVPKFDLQEKIANITSQINNLDVKEVAQSSPQVQKVLKDMESLKDLPKSQAKEACMKICGGL